MNPDGDSERDAEAPEVTAAWLEDMGLMIVSAVEPELDADEVETECSDDGRTCWIRGPLTTVEGHHALMSRVQEAIASGVLSPRDVTELAVSALSAEAWDDGRPGFALEVSLDP